MVRQPGCRSVIHLLVGCLLFAAETSVAWSAEHTKSPHGTASRIDLFQALEAGIVQAELCTLDPSRVRLQLRNAVGYPVCVQIPETFGAVDDLEPAASIHPLTLAVAGNVFRAESGDDPLQTQLHSGSFHRLDADERVKLNLPSLRVDFGSLPFSPRRQLRLARLSDIHADSRIESIVIALGNGQCTPSVAQLAAWRISNPEHWLSISRTTVVQGRGMVEPQFDRGEFQAARRLVDSLTSRGREIRNADFAHLTGN